MHNPNNKQYIPVEKVVYIGERQYDDFRRKSSTMDASNTKGMPFSPFDHLDEHEMIHDPKKYREDKKKTKKSE